MITAKEAASLLDGNEYREEGSRELTRQMRESGLVAVYGGSDDLIYFDGAVNDELGANPGEPFIFTKDGLLRSKCDDDDCPYFAEIRKKATSHVTPFWDRDDIPWTYDSNIPHETFNIMEDGDIYCRGIVFALKDVA